MILYKFKIYCIYIDNYILLGRHSLVVTAFQRTMCATYPQMASNYLLRKDLLEQVNPGGLFLLARKIDWSRLEEAL